MTRIMTRKPSMLFDCDGTLLDSIDAWDQVFEKLVQDAGIVFTAEMNEEMAKLSIPETGVYLHERFGLGGSADGAVEMLDAGLMDYYKNRACERSGALEFVKAMLRLGVTCSVLSSSPKKYLEAGLKRAGFSDYLYTIVSVDDLNTSKREPEIFLHACRLMGSEPENCWVFEDSLYALQVASAAGFKTVGIYERDAAGSYSELQEIADVVVRNFGELVPGRFVS